MNFNIIEGDYTDFESIYPIFKELFLNEKVNVEELKEKFNLSRKEYLNLRKQVLCETGLTCKPHLKSKNSHITNLNPEYISKHNQKFCIYKRINNERVYFGCYDNLEFAREVRDSLIESGWDKEKLNEIVNQKKGYR